MFAPDPAHGLFQPYLEEPQTVGRRLEAVGPPALHTSHLALHTSHSAFYATASPERRATSDAAPSRPQTTNSQIRDTQDNAEARIFLLPAPPIHSIIDPIETHAAPETRDRHKPSPRQLCAGNPYRLVGLCVTIATCGVKKRRRQGTETIGGCPLYSCCGSVKQDKRMVYI